MTFTITMPTEEDLAPLPIADLTPNGIWTLSDFNETDPSLSFVDSYFDPPCFAQTVATTLMQGGEDGLDNIPMMNVTSNAGEDPSASKIMDNLIPDIFYDTSDLTPDDEIFQDKHYDMDGLYYFDPSDLDHVTDFMGHDFHLTLDPDDAIDSHDVDKLLFMLGYDELRGAHEAFNSFAYVSQTAVRDHAHKYVEYLGYQLIDIIWKTLENITQLATTTLQFPMR